MSINLLLFIITLIVVFVVVRIGAIAFQLTGVDWVIAKFQALSCFSGTGFTTRESELITHNPKRRRIASILMVLGNAGLVTLIATFANTIRDKTAGPKITIPYLHLIFPSSLLPLINLILVFVCSYLVYRLFNYTRFMEKLTTYIRSHLIKNEVIRKMTAEELLLATGGYAVVTMSVDPLSPIVNKTLLGAELRRNDVSVLVIERNKEVIPNPMFDTKILAGDKLICFGKLENIRKEILPKD